MAKVVVTLSFSVSGPTQALAAAKAKRHARAALKQCRRFLPGVWFADPSNRNPVEVDKWSDARLTRGLEIIVRQYLAEAANAWLVAEAEDTHVKPIRDAAPYIEEPSADVP